MRRLFNTNYNHRGLDVGTLILRLGVAGMMLTHGYPKFQGLLEGGEIQFADPYGLGVTFTMIFAVFAEFFCSLLILLGLATRLATIPLLITMGTVVFVIHAADGFGKQEMGLHFMLVYVFLLIAGPGRFSIDNLISSNMRRRRR